jgi:vitamin B12 transporter
MIRKHVVVWTVLPLMSVVLADEPLAVIEREALIVSGESVPSSQVYGHDAVSATTLAMLPMVDLRSQGIAGGQADMSIRGSSFSGAGIALNGFALPNAQTEHFNTELPIHSGLLSLPAVYTGFEQTLSGEGHLIGTADFSILPIRSRRYLSAGMSEKESFYVNTLIQQRWHSPVGAPSVGIGAFAGYAEENAVDYPDNDVRSRRVGGQAQWMDRHGGQWDLLLGRQEKKFGARGYYGVTPSWKADEETEDTLLFAGWTYSRDEGNRVRASAMYRDQSDDYTLYWTLPGDFNNSHNLETYGASVDGRLLAGDSGMLDWRITTSEQRIRSNSLGDHQRAQMGIAAVPGIGVGKWTFQAGTRFEIFQEEPNGFLPQVALGYQVTDQVDLRVAYSESVRQPSYTELNYESPASLGNAGLKNQTASTAEFLINGGNASCQLTWSLGVFQQTTRNTVDWIRPAASSTRWEAFNIGSVDTVGVEVDVQWQSRMGSRLAAHYTGMTKSEDTELYASRYALDYPEHRLQIAGTLPLASRVALALQQEVRSQAPNALRGRSDMAYDASLALHILALKAPNAMLTLAIQNLWDDDFEIFPGQATVSPQRMSASLTMDW